jgi:hypothetical protein
MSKKTKNFILSAPLIIILFIAISVFGPKFWAQEMCTEFTSLFTENFHSEDYKDKTYSSVSFWPPGPVTLSWLGGQLNISQPVGMGGKIYVCDKGDFDSDGLPDLIGYDISAGYSQGKLVLVRNKFVDANHDGIDDDGIIFQVDTSKIFEQNITGQVPSITVGDYNGDGLLDFFFCKNDSDYAEYKNFLAAMYINIGTATNPNFNTYTSAPNLDFTSKFQSKPIYIRWAGDHMCSVDIDKDGDTDILFMGQNKIWLIRNPGPGNFSLANFVISEVSYNTRPGFPTGSYTYMGGSAIDAADFDRDGDLDIVVGSVEWVDHLVYYSNDGTGNFIRYDIPITNSSCIGTTAISSGDFDNDGRMDLMCSNDRWRTGNLAKLYMFKNKGNNEGGGIPVNFEFKCLSDCNPINPPENDDDVLVAIDYDLDGDMDVITADANDSGDYFMLTNGLADVYTLYGEACSTNVLAGMDESLYAVTKVGIKTLHQGIRGGSSYGLTITYYLSNNGIDWELFATYEGSNIHDYSNLPPHTFEHYGSKLFWKAVMSAPEDQMSDFTSASYDTPYISSIQFECFHVERKEYSRTSAAATFISHEGSLRTYIIGSSFYYPGWQGHLRAYDMSAMTPENSPYSVLRTITQSNLSSPTGRNMLVEGVEIVWDAGQLLSLRSADDRKIYTAIPSETRLTRVDFTASNAETLGPIIKDVNNDDAALINFVRGAGRDWKLGDSNHSTPVVVGPPEENASLMGSGYLQFKDNWKERHQVLYIGANDGMLHCFDMVSGEELWAYIPYNLLPKLRNMCNIDPDTGERTYTRDTYVDGSPTAADVYIDANGDGVKEWITILVCGQAQGKGSTLGGGLNYYFALDVTNPNSPQPLWKFTDSAMGETWSVPAIGKIVKNGSDTWVAFVGSGYDNDDNNVVGNKFYAVDLETGSSFWSFSDSGVDTRTEHGFTWDIQNAFVGSPSIIDIDQDGRVDRVYFADLDGRVWRAYVSVNFQNESSWPVTNIYEDAKNFPILSKPAIWMKSGGYPRIYFGTGGDESAPNDVKYSFVALIDKATPEVEWYLGDPAVLSLPVTKDSGDLDVGEKVWVDPVIANYICYFNTLKGNIESVDPCENIIGVGELYARYVESVAGAIFGGTALRIETGPTESLQLEIKTRGAATLAERQTTGNSGRKRAVYIQEYNSTIQKMEQTVLATLKIKSWREIFRIMK